jgi:hypothetical protein
MMALIHCPECGNQVSSLAPTCPNCGCPIAKPQAAPYPTGSPYDPPGWNQSMPPTYLAQAILATLFCCMPFGVVAIVKSSQVSSAWGAGNHELAYQKSKEASTWVNVSAICGLIVVVFYVVAAVISSQNK